MYVLKVLLYEIKRAVWWKVLTSLPLFLFGKIISLLLFFLYANLELMSIRVQVLSLPPLRVPAPTPVFRRRVILEIEEVLASELARGTCLLTLNHLHQTCFVGFWRTATPFDFPLKMAENTNSSSGKMVRFSRMMTP